MQGLGSRSDALEGNSDILHAPWGRPAQLRNSVTFVDAYVSPQRCIELIRSLRALVSMRMHPVIIATSLGVPSLLIGTPAKASDFADIGMGQAATDGELGDGDTLARFAGMWRGKTPRGRALWKAVEPARDRAAKNDLVMQALLGAARARARLRAGEV